MADLIWFPFFAKSWLSSPARIAMLPEQRGAYIDLLAIAWAEGDELPSLPADDATLAALSGLGTRWKKLGALIRAQFHEHDGRLFNAKLTEVWGEQQKKHASSVARGKKGGSTKAARLKQGSSSATDEVKHIEVEEAVETSPKGLALPASAPSGALAPEAPRAPAPIPALARYVQPPSDDPDPEDVELRRAYRERLEELVGQWCERNPEDAAAIEEAAKVELLPPLMRQNPTPAQRRVVRERVKFEVARRNPKWPAEDQWCAQQRLLKLEESAA